MFTTSEKRLALAACGGWLLAAAGICSPFVLANDAKPANNAQTCQVRVEVRGKVPFLDKIPIAKYFFSTEKDEKHQCVAEGKSPCADVEIEEFERIGVDFDLMPGHMVTFLPTGECQVVCPEKGYATCPANTVKEASAECCAENKTCPASACKSCETQFETAASLNRLVAQECELNHEHCAVRDHAICDHVSELKAENAALESALQAHEALSAAKDEMFEMMLQLSTENAQLASKLEFMQQRDELHEKLLTVVAENSKLKAAAELAAEKQTILGQSLEVALENERLKLRVAELEQRNSEYANASVQRRQASKKRAVK